MSKNRQKTTDTPLVVLYKILCDAVFDDEHGANETTFNALSILGNAIDKKIAKEITDKVTKEDDRYKYAEW